MPDPAPQLLNRHFDGALFDMDGTILTSIIAAERVWARWARRHRLDIDAFLPTLHGVRTIETIRRQNLPGIDAEAEAAWVTREEMIDTDGIEEIPGAGRFLRALPTDRWAIVTSATRELALRRIEIAGLPSPPLLISSEDVSRGKPEPECFLLGARKLGLDIEHCAVFEDAPAGIAAGVAAGATVVVVTHTHAAPPQSHHAAIADYHALRVSANTDGSFRFG